MQRIRPWLTIGRYRETLDAALLAAEGIGAMLLLAAPVEQPGIVARYLPIADGETLTPAQLRAGVDFVLVQRAAGRNVLVACGAGISRATTFTIAALKEAESLSLRDAASIVRHAHADGRPHPVLWASLCSYYAEPGDYMTLVRRQEPPA